MFSLPAPPQTWDGFHPLFVHLPLGLAYVVPILVILALLLRKHAFGINLAALVVMGVAALGSFLSVWSGEAAADVAQPSGPAAVVLHDHEETAEAARTFMIVLFAALALFVFVPTRLKKRPPSSALAGAGILYIIAHGVMLVMLANAGHLGGRLVHEFGIRGRIGGSSPASDASHPAAEPQQIQSGQNARRNDQGHKNEESGDREK